MINLDTNSWFIGGISTGPYPCDPVTPQEIIIDVESRNSVNGYADGRSQTGLDIKQVIISPTEHIIRLGFLQNLDLHARRRQLAEKIERGEY